MANLVELSSRRLRLAFVAMPTIALMQAVVACAACAQGASRRSPVQSPQSGVAVDSVADSTRRKPVKSQPKPGTTITRPDFKNLRFDEVWTRAMRSSHWDDQIKAIPLAPQVSLTLSGQLRWREEFAQNYNFTSPSDNYGQSRTLLDADLQVGDAKRVHGRLFGGFRDAQSYNRDLPGGTRASDADRADFQNLFVDLGYARSYVRYGRQEVVANRERLLGVPDWSNTRRSFQGTRVLLVVGAFAFDALDARPVVVRLNASDIGDTTTRFRVVSVGSAPGAAALLAGLPSTWQAYWYEQVVSVATPTRRLTTGGRVAWTFGGATKTSQAVGVESEAAVQSGAVGARQIRAWFWTTEAQAQFRGVLGAPTLVIGLEEASGDRSSTDSKLEAFNQLYGAAHGHGGYADVFGRANARETHVISTWDPVRLLNLRAAWYRYDRLRLEDGVYNKQNTLLRAASGSTDRHAGDEVDLTSSLNLTRHLKIIAGHAWVLPGAFLVRTPGSARQERWGYAGTTFTF
jgi:hypothetical protein